MPSILLRATTLGLAGLAMVGAAAAQQPGRFRRRAGRPDRVPTGLRAPGAEQNKQFVLDIVRWLARAQS